MEYNERIKQFRTQKGVTQQQLADDIGVSRQSVVRWENGFTVPSMYYAQKLAQYFGITVTELMTGLAEQNKAEKFDREFNIKRTTSTIMFCLTTFIIFVCYVLLCNLSSTLQYYLTQTGENYIVVKSTFKMLNAMIDGAVVVAMAVALTVWIVRLIAWLGVSSDKFLWYGIYKKWSVGLAVWLVNILAAVAVMCVYIMSVIFLYAAAAVIAVPLFYLADYAVKKALGGRMVVARNRTLNIINAVYCVVVSVGVAALIAWIIFAVTTLRPTYGLEVAFAVLYFCFAAVGIIVSYVITRIILYSVAAHRAKK